MNGMNIKALVGVSLLLFAVKYSPAEPELLMRQMVGPLLTKPGEYFALTKTTILTSVKGKEREFVVKKILGSNEEYDGQLSRFNGAKADSLAEEYVRASDGYLSTSSSWMYYSAMAEARGDKNPPRVLNDIYLPNGKKARMPLQTANMLDAWTMSEIEKASKKRMKPVSVAGKYSATTKGSCPFADTDVEMSQIGFNVEGHLNDELLLWGRVGEKLIYIQLAEVKYSEVYGPKEMATINFPTRPSDIYVSDINPDELVFNGMNYNECVLIMRKLKSLGKSKNSE